MMKNLMPLIVGGTGGSGTRLVAQMLQSLGVQLGKELKPSLDATAFLKIYNDHIGPWMAQKDCCPEVFHDDLTRAIERHRSGMTPSGHWGWKNPRSIYLLPLWQACLPGFRFVHVIRDGLTMANSANQNQLRKHGAQLLEAEADLWPKNWRSLLLWARVNIDAADFGEKHLGLARYYRIRYEDATQKPLLQLQGLARWLNLPEPAVCSVDVNIGRGRELEFPHDSPVLLRQKVQQAMNRFGYPC